jgi:hypothetical protein
MTNSNQRPVTLVVAFTLVLTLGLLGGGCSDSTAPSADPPAEGTVIFDGSYEGSEFVLQRLNETTPDGRFVSIDLVGRGLQLDDTGEGVSIEVAVRNSADRRGTKLNLYPRVLVSLQDFRPPEVFVTNADFILGGCELCDSLATGDILPSRQIWIFDYSDQLGDDGFLSPGETSGFRRWVFRDPSRGSFSFQAHVEFGLEPARPSVSGVVFTDLDRNGEFNGVEEGMQFGTVEMLRPDGSRAMVEVGREGVWSMPVREPGLYTVTFHPPPTLGFAPICLTTPNPLSVLLPPAPDGSAQSFEDANFGIDPEPCFRPVFPLIELADRRPDPSVVPQDFYRLLDIGLSGDHLLRMRVGYSGCNGGHALRLFAGRNFAESLPAQTWALLAHDSEGQLCDAYFEEDLVFDLTPLRRSHEEQYGSPGPFDLVFEDFAGQRHTVRIP